MGTRLAAAPAGICTCRREIPKLRMRIGIVNDAVMAREALRRVVASAPGHVLAWLAKDGAEAIDRAREEPVDLILMDLFMPGIDGVEATRRIMAESPCAIVVVTATVSGHLSKVYQALGYGALDATDTPSLGLRGDVAGADSLLRKIDTIAKLLGKPVASATPDPDVGTGSWSQLSGEFPTVRGPQPDISNGVETLILIGASTGGPQALAEVLRGIYYVLDQRQRTAVVIVQHLDANFTMGLSRWLGEQSGRPVRLIDEGQRPEPGDILLAGTGDHLILNAEGRFSYTPEPKSIPYRPSVDVFFSSVADVWPRPGIAVILTGMGRDGAEGLAKLRRRRWHTIAQDQATCVVWGMPRAAAEIGAAELVLPLPHIAETVAGWARTR